MTESVASTTGASAATASPASSTAAPAAGSGAGGGPAAIGIPGSGASSPVFSMKCQCSILDSAAFQSTTGLDGSSMQRTLGCHDGSAFLPEEISPQTPGSMGDVAEHWFSQPRWLQFPDIEQAGPHALRQPGTETSESLREPTSTERAQSSIDPADNSDPVGSRRIEPTPENAAIASEPSRVPSRSTDTMSANTPEGFAPILGPRTEATILGTVSGTIEAFFNELPWEFLYEEFAFGGKRPGAREHFEKAREEFDDLSAGLGLSAVTRDPFFGTAGSAVGYFGLSTFSPGSKGTATAKAGGKVLNKSRKAMPRKVRPKHVSPDFELFVQAARRPGFDNHHIALKAIFERANDPIIQSIYYELRSVPLSKQTHQTLHKIIDNELRKVGLMPSSRGRGTKEAFNRKEVEQALQVLAYAYRRERVDDFAEHIEGFINAMRNAGLF